MMIFFLGIGYEKVEGSISSLHSPDTIFISESTV